MKSNAWRDAVWINGTREIRGRWIYTWNADRFDIQLDQTDRVTGANKSLRVYGDRPEWGSWKLADRASKDHP